MKLQPLLPFWEPDSKMSSRVMYLPQEQIFYSQDLNENQPLRKLHTLKIYTQALQSLSCYHLHFQEFLRVLCIHSFPTCTCKYNHKFRAWAVSPRQAKHCHQELQLLILFLEYIPQQE